MKLATWNCAMGLKKKIPKLLSLSADVMIIQECSRSDIEQLGQSHEWSPIWFGKNKNKGLGVAAKAPWVVREAQALKTQPSNTSSKFTFCSTGLSRLLSLPSQ